METLRIVIVDDESKSRSNLRMMLEKYITGVAVIGEAGNADAAEELIREVKPDVILLDVEMPVFSGFDLLQRFPSPDFEVIFCTAHGHYAIPAIRASALDYLLKPINLNELKRAIASAQQVIPDRAFRKGRTEALIENLNPADRNNKIAIPDLKGINFIDQEQILFLKADGSYTELHLTDGAIITSSRTLKDYQDILVSYGFFRVSKSYMVNLIHVQRYIKGSGGFVLMNNGQEIEVARRRKEELLDKMINQ